MVSLIISRQCFINIWSGLNSTKTLLVNSLLCFFINILFGITLNKVNCSWLIFSSLTDFGLIRLTFQASLPSLSLISFNRNPLLGWYSLIFACFRVACLLVRTILSSYIFINYGTTCQLWLEVHHNFFNILICNILLLVLCLIFGFIF